MQQNIGYNPQGALVLRVVITCGIKLLGTVVEKLCKTFYNNIQSSSMQEQIDECNGLSPLHDNITNPSDCGYHNIANPMS